LIFFGGWWTLTVKLSPVYSTLWQKMTPLFQTRLISDLPLDPDIVSVDGNLCLPTLRIFRCSVVSAWLFPPSVLASFSQYPRSFIPYRWKPGFIPNQIWIFLSFYLVDWLCFFLLDCLWFRLWKRFLIHQVYQDRQCFTSYRKGYSLTVSQRNRFQEYFLIFIFEPFLTFILFPLWLPFLHFFAQQMKPAFL
jgi:hypothetical protein